MRTTDIKIIGTLRTWFLLCLVLLAAVIGKPTVANETAGSVAFYYGANPPVNSLSQFDRLILESENIRPSELRKLKQHGSSAYAYLSIGEVGPQRSWKHLLNDEWIMGSNTTWNSTVMDMTNIGWHDFVLQRVKLLLDQGYDGVFLDTMDSYKIYSHDITTRSLQEGALAELIGKIKHQHPLIKLISNRGFDVMDKIGVHMESVAAESLFSGWNNEENTYQPVPEADRQWLQAKLTEVKNKHNLDVIAIDYVAPANKDKALEVAKKIDALGFTPWVGNPSLDNVGVSNLEVIPREVIMLYESDGPVEEAPVHSLLAMPLEYMGYVPVYHNIAEKGLPHGTLKGAYAGVVLWMDKNIEGHDYAQWLSKHLDDQLPVAIFGSLGTELTATFSEQLGLAAVGTVDILTMESIASTNMIGFETPTPLRLDQLPVKMKNDDPRNTSHLTFKDQNGTQVDAVITGPWGGLAMHPTIVDYGVENIPNWIIDPFEFLKTSLQLTDAPMPDITSENGKRLWFAHIDGHAMPSWAELPGRRLGSEVIRDEIITRYELPHAISIVEAEMYTEDRRERMEKTARDLFALDYVEIATHTYSHPFEWKALQPGSPSGVDNLPIPGYKFDIDREIGGSARYIDTNLAPPGKKTKVVLWSGDAVPPADAIATAEQYGLLNMNGGYTIISKQTPTVAAISPNARTVGDQTQVYAPIMNENVFTNEWTGPFDGYKRVIETFDMTGHPRRIKPVNVYYHFYAGTKKSALSSLETVYDWSVKQDLMPIMPSEYIVKVPHFRSAGVARDLNGRWKVTGLGPIKSLRTLSKNSFPNLSNSESLIGTVETHDAVYLHTNGADSASFELTHTKPDIPHLVSANAKAHYWQHRPNGTIEVRLSGALPVKFEIGGSLSNCQMVVHGKVIHGEETIDGHVRFNLSTKDTGDANIDCKS